MPTNENFNAGPNQPDPQSGAQYSTPGSGANGSGANGSASNGYSSYDPNGLPPQNNPQVVYVQPEKKPWYRRAGCITSIVIAVVLLAIVGGCTALTGQAFNEVDKQMNTEHTVTYEISGDAQDATVTYNVNETESAQDSGIAAGWTKDVTVKGFWGAMLTASNGPNDTGEITCKISANGKVLTENTATGEFATATCSVDPTALSEAFE